MSWGILKMTSIQKVLISYDELVRLKDIEKRFESVNSELAALKRTEKGTIFHLTVFFVCFRLLKYF